MSPIVLTRTHCVEMDTGVRAALDPARAKHGRGQWKSWIRKLSALKNWIFFYKLFMKSNVSNFSLLPLRFESFLYIYVYAHTAHDERGHGARAYKCVTFLC